MKRLLAIPLLFSFLLAFAAGLFVVPAKRAEAQSGRKPDTVYLCMYGFDKDKKVWFVSEPAQCKTLEDFVIFSIADPIYAQPAGTINGAVCIFQDTERTPFDQPDNLTKYPFYKIEFATVDTNGLNPTCRTNSKYPKDVPKPILLRNIDGSPIKRDGAYVRPPGTNPPNVTPPSGTDPGNNSKNLPPGCNPKTFTGTPYTFKMIMEAEKEENALIADITARGTNFTISSSEEGQIKLLYSERVVNAAKSNLRCTTIDGKPVSGGGTTPPVSGGGGGNPSGPPAGYSRGDCEEGFHQDGVLCIPNPVVNGPSSIQDLAAKVIKFMLYLAGIVAVIMIIIGGYQVMTAAGDAGQASNGKKTLVNALIGLIIVVLSYAIVQTVYNFIIK